MASLIVRNIDDGIAQALKQRASARGISAEAEHRRILQQALMPPKKRSFMQLIAEMPNVGRDEDFARQDEGKQPKVFD
jgi:plasmid stability protein